MKKIPSTQVIVHNTQITCERFFKCEFNIKNNAVYCVGSMGSILYDLLKTSETVADKDYVIQLNRSAIMMQEKIHILDRGVDE